MDSNKIADYIKIPHFFKDVVYFLIGINFIFFINYHYKPNIECIPNFNLINDFGRLSFIFVLSYTSGRVLKIVADLWLDFWFLLFKNDLWKTIKETYRDFLGIANKSVYSVPLDLNNINHEVEKFIQENGYLKNNFERSVYSDAFIKGLIGLSLVVTVSEISWKIFIITIILTFISILGRIKRNKLRQEIARAVHKQRTMILKK